MIKERGEKERDRKERKNESAERKVFGAGFLGTVNGGAGWLGLDFGAELGTLAT